MKSKHTGPGKGSEARPFSISLEEFGDNWDLAFRKKKSSKRDKASLSIKRDKRLSTDKDVA
jgi:hypothetical protein